MTITTHFTRNQPEHWNRYTLGDCFKISTLPMGALTKPASLKAEIGDVIVDITRDMISARLATEAEEITSTRMALLRAKGPMKPEWAVMLLCNKSLARELFKSGYDSGSVVGSFRARELREVVVAVPDLPTQVMMTKAYEDGVGWAYAHADCLRKQSDILIQMGDGIAHQILMGKADRKQTLTWIRQAVEPLFPSPSPSKDVDYLTSAQIQQAPSQGHYVSQEQHDAKVSALMAQIKALENPVGSEPPTPSRSPRP
jgi:hypothetical protein